MTSSPAFVENPVTSFTYFAESCPPLATQLDEVCAGIAASVGPAVHEGVAIRAIVLGGGYGRGEGGVWRGVRTKPSNSSSDGVPSVALHNDLDFFLFSDRPSDPALRTWLAAQEERWSAHLGIHVDFACLSPRVIDRAGDSMMLTDLVLGYRPVFGDTGFLELAARTADPVRLPLWEASRLLWNRGSGLYFSRCRIADRRAGEFIERNHQKLALALGDALLCLAGEHHPSVIERARRFADLDLHRLGFDEKSFGARLRRLHEAAVEFKLRPRPVAEDWQRWQGHDQELTALWAAVFLLVESARLGRKFPHLKSYAQDRQRLVPETSALKNVLIAARDRKRYGSALKPAVDYPRGALMRSLAAIHSGDLERASELLPEAAADEIPTLETRYTTWWQRYQ